MAITIDEVVEIYPEFDGNDRLELFIGLAEDILNEAQIGDKKYRPMVAALAAHMLKQNSAEGEALAGPVTMERVGQLSASYATSLSSKGLDPELAATSYGRTFMFYRRLCFPNRFC